jgi:hypothetical protein
LNWHLYSLKLLFIRQREGVCYLFQAILNRFGNRCWQDKTE